MKKLVDKVVKATEEVIEHMADKLGKPPVEAEPMPQRMLNGGATHAEVQAWLDARMPKE